MRSFARCCSMLLPVLLPGLAGGCASELPVSTSFDSSAGAVVVEVLGDGFVRAGRQRMPLEALVLELRQRTRAMSAGDLARFVVRVRVDPAVEQDGARALRAQEDVNRLLDELDIMDVGQAVLL